MEESVQCEVIRRGVVCGEMGGSVSRLQELVAMARENNGSIVIDLLIFKSYWVCHWKEACSEICYLQGWHSIKKCG